MFTGINPTGSVPLTGISSYNAHSPAAEPPKIEQQNCDQFLCSPAPEGEEGRIRSLVGQISQKIDIRPTNHELSALRQQIQEGSYRPDAGAIASRMLLMDPLED